MTPLKIDNRAARRLWLTSQGLGHTPTGPFDLVKTIKRLGFVQLDSIQAVARAHHHILWSRNQNYRSKMLDHALARDRTVFEHFTHDASVIPTAFYPMWTRQFRRRAVEFARVHKGLPDAAARDRIKARIAAEGALSTHAFDSKIEGPREMWSRPPHKKALDYMWFAGELATCHRINFAKYYNLAERVIPEAYRTPLEDDAQIMQLCDTALDRLSFGTLSEVRRFWDATEVAEVKAWHRAADTVPVEIQSANGQWTQAVAPPDIEARLAAATEVTSRLRILNPFDPVIRDRDRLSRLFGFDYRIEIFVPAAKRKWGYYVFPILQGDRFVGRIEAKASRPKDTLTILNLWKEPGVKWGAKRFSQLDAELVRLARFVNVSTIDWACARA